MIMAFRLTILLVVLFGGAVDAMSHGLSIPSLDGLYVPFGISWASSREYGSMIGGEVSCARLWEDGLLDNARWIGVYSDFQMTIDPDRSFRSFSVGPEFGWLIFGFDCGYSMTGIEGKFINGFSFRFHLALGIIDSTFLVQPFIRRVFFHESSDYIEMGIVLKHAVRLSRS